MSAGFSKSLSDSGVFGVYTLSLFLPSHLWVRGAWSDRGAMYPNHISTRANPKDSWGIFTAQLKHELDGSFVDHLYKLLSLSSAYHCKPQQQHQPRTQAATNERPQVSAAADGNFQVLLDLRLYKFP